jgi:hypothetical protein
MRIQSDELFAGFPAIQIKELLGQNDQYVSVNHVDKVLGLEALKEVRYYGRKIYDM